MRFDPAKSYPHPVLRRWSSDYPDAEFQVDITSDRRRGGTELLVRAEFELSDPDLQALVDAGRALYVLRVLASRTHLREAVTSSTPEIEKVFDEGLLHGRVVFSPFLVSCDSLRSFAAAGWHSDYRSLRFDIDAGSVLAEDEPKEYWIDTAEDAPIGSIFKVRPTNDAALDQGIWRCGLDEQKLILEMAVPDYERFVSAREKVKDTSDVQYLMNAVYLPALIYVLQEADRGEEEYGDLRWYRSLNARLNDTAGCGRLGAKGADRLKDAQRLLHAPFGRMPVVAEVDAV